MVRQRETSPEVEAEITKLYAEKATTAELAAKFDLHKNQIARIVRRNGGLVRGRGPNRLPVEQEAEMVKEYAAGVPVREIAKRYKVHPTSISDVAVRHGIEKRPDRPPYRAFSDEELREMQRMWGDGRSQTAIAEAFGTSQSVVSRVLRQHGIVPTTRQRPQHGERNNQWKGGRIITEYGYVSVLMDPDHRFASMRNRMGYVMEHRLVMAESLGRPLDDHETVHHINGEKTDNRPENLQLRQGRHGKGVVATCLDCGSHNIGTAPIADHDG